MTRTTPRKPLEIAADHLRAISLSSEVGVFVGREDELIAELGVARATLRQAARLLEQQGLLQVKRGANGGYFTSRPSAKIVENVLGTYLDTQRLDFEETFIVGYALWAEAISEAARLNSPEIQTIIRSLGKRLNAIADDASMFDIVSFENDYRQAFFRLVKRPYLELFFQLNRSLTWRYLNHPPWRDGRLISDPQFTTRWRECKTAEFGAVESGDESATIEAIQRSRVLWRQRLFSISVLSTSSAS